MFNVLIGRTGSGNSPELNKRVMILIGKADDVKSVRTRSKDLTKFDTQARNAQKTVFGSGFVQFSIYQRSTEKSTIRGHAWRILLQV